MCLCLYCKYYLKGVVYIDRVQLKQLRKGIKPGNNKTLWEAVKIVKDQNIEELPDQMNLDGIPIQDDQLAELSTVWKTIISSNQISLGLIIFKQ